MDKSSSQLSGLSDASYSRFCGMVRTVRRNRLKEFAILKSSLEFQFEMQLVYNKTNVPAFEKQLRFNPSRKWKSDFGWKDYKLLVEIEGGVYTNGRHVRGSGFEKDCEKYNSAVLDGWKILRFGPNHVKNGSAIATVVKFFSNNNK
jgi:very-short-patch-repair endonuclease